MTESWSAAQIPPQTGRLAVVTSAAGGLGYATALALAQAGADVVVAASDEFEGFRAVSQMRPQAKTALIRFEKLDTASLNSVTAFAYRMASAGRPIDLVINHSNAPMHLNRRVTSDGFELQLGMNYLAHFALTARLMPLLRQGRKPRVVHLSSLCHRRGSIHFDDLQMERGYDPWLAHCQSMLASLLFAQELQRRSAAGQWGVASVAAHPGNVRPRLLANAFAPRSLSRRLRGSLGFQRSHSASEGALPVLFSATSPDAQPGGFYGPGGPFELVGPPELAGVGRNASDIADSQRLWEMSEQLTGVRWEAA